MPSTSKKQHNLMAAVAHNPAFAKKVGIPQSVGMDFNKADKGKTFKGGGMAKKLFGGKETVKEELAEAKAIKSGKISPMQYAMGEESEKPKKMACGLEKLRWLMLKNAKQKKWLRKIDFYILKHRL